MLNILCFSAILYVFLIFPNINEYMKHRGKNTSKSRDIKTKFELFSSFHCAINYLYLITLSETHFKYKLSKISASSDLLK